MTHSCYLSTLTSYESLSQATSSSVAAAGDALQVE